MNQLFVLALLCVSAVSGYELSEYQSDDYADDGLDPRFLFFNSTGSLIPLNAASLLASLGLLAILALLGIGLWLLLGTFSSKFSGGGGYGGGYGGGGYSGGYSGGSSYSGYGQARYSRRKTLYKADLFCTKTGGLQPFVYAALSVEDPFVLSKFSNLSVL